MDEVVGLIAIGSGRARGEKVGANWSPVSEDGAQRQEPLQLLDIKAKKVNSQNQEGIKIIISNQ